MLDHLFSFYGIIGFLLFFIPGYLFLRTHSLKIPCEKMDFAKDLYEIIAISALNNIIWAIPLYYIFITNANIIILSTCLLFALIISPIAFAFLWIRISNMKFYKKHFLNHQYATPWEAVFMGGQSFWIIVTLKNNKKIAGKFQEKSYASAYPSPKEIFIEEVWDVDETGYFKDKRYPNAKTAGILILENEISTIELLK